MSPADRRTVSLAPADGAPPVYGLVLAGGRSSRMQRDKAALLYRGVPQLERTILIARPHVAKVFISARPTQMGDPARAGAPLIVDAVEGEGPLVGIRSALAAHPDAAWLVLACDLPFLSSDALYDLLAQRDPAAPATAYTSAHDGLPEPLCAIWEPSSAPLLAAYQENGGRCPRKFLMRHATHLLEPRDHQALDNVNTPEEYAQALARMELG